METGRSVMMETGRSVMVETGRSVMDVAFCVLVEASSFGALETFTVPQGETVVRDAAYSGCTNTALTVSGTLDLAVDGPYVLCAVNADGTYDADWAKKPTMHLAPNADDEGVLNITNGMALGTQVGVTFGSHLTVGVQGWWRAGADQRRRRRSDEAKQLSPRHAASARHRADGGIVDIGYNAALELLALRNDTAKLLVVAFTNDMEDAASANPAVLRQFYDSSPLHPSTQVGGDIVLRGEPRSPVRLDSWGTTPWKFFRSTASKANLVTEGACGFVVQCPEKGVTLNLTNVVWRHAGDTVLKPKSDGASFCVKHPTSFRGGRRRAA